MHFCCIARGRWLSSLIIAQGMATEWTVKQMKKNRNWHFPSVSFIFSESGGPERWLWSEVQLHHCLQQVWWQAPSAEASVRGWIPFYLSRPDHDTIEIHWCRNEVAKDRREFILVQQESFCVQVDPQTTLNQSYTHTHTHTHTCSKVKLMLDLLNVYTCRRNTKYSFFVEVCCFLIFAGWWTPFWRKRWKTSTHSPKRLWHQNNGKNKNDREKRPLTSNCVYIIMKDQS